MRKPRAPGCRSVSRRGGSGAPARATPRFADEFGPAAAVHQEPHAPPRRSRPRPCSPARLGPALRRGCPAEPSQAHPCRIARTGRRCQGRAGHRRGVQGGHGWYGRRDGWLAHGSRLNMRIGRRAASLLPEDGIVAQALPLGLFAVVARRVCLVALGSEGQSAISRRGEKHWLQARVEIEWPHDTKLADVTKWQRRQ